MRTSKKKLTEKQIENQIKKWLDKLPNCWYFKVHGDAFQKSGVPDIVACINGRFVGIEVKRPDGRLHALQAYTIEQINNTKGVAFVATSVDEVRTTLEKLNVIPVSEERT